MNSSGDKVLIRSSDDDIETWLGLRNVEEETADDRQSFVTLRPQGFSEYIGQEKIKENLLIACRAAKKRGDSLDHLLLHGPPGLGKTSLAKVVAGELGVGFKSTSGPVIEKPGDIAAILTSLEANDVLFIDEIHRMPRVVEEVLYPALEDFELDILIGQGPAAKSVRIDLKPFTLVGATTRTGLLTSPLRDRFGLVYRLNYYTKEELKKIAQRSSDILGVVLQEDAAYELAGCARGTPRILNRLLKRVRDFAEDKADGVITKELTRQALSLLDIDECGLDKMDRLILETIIDRFSGGPVGVETIAAAVGEERETIEDVYEPYLVQEGYIARTRRGRAVMEKGYLHLGRPFKSQQISLKLS